MAKMDWAGWVEAQRRVTEPLSKQDARFLPDPWHQVLVHHCHLKTIEDIPVSVVCFTPCRAELANCQAAWRWKPRTPSKLRRKPLNRTGNKGAFNIHRLASQIEQNWHSRRSELCEFRGEGSPGTYLYHM